MPLSVQVVGDTSTLAHRCRAGGGVHPIAFSDPDVPPLVAGQQPSSLNASGLIIDCRSSTLTSRWVFS